MAVLTRKDIVAMFGELDDIVVAEIIATEATAQELAEAHEWLTNDEALINAGRHLPSGRVGRLVEIVAAKEQEEAEDEAVGGGESTCRVHGGRVNQPLHQV